jgi:hypothetical protein
MLRAMPRHREPLLLARSTTCYYLLVFTAEIVYILTTCNPRIQQRQNTSDNSIIKNVQHDYESGGNMNTSRIKSANFFFWIRRTIINTVHLSPAWSNSSHFQSKQNPRNP